MALIDMFEITKRYGDKVILDKVDFHLQEGERVAVVGPNGAGKSTLLKIAVGEIEPDSGKRIVDSSVEIKMLSQNPTFEENVTVKEAILKELKELLDAQKEYQKLTKELESDFENSELLNRLEEVGKFLDHHNAWNLDSKIERALNEFKLKEYENRLVTSLSGGEQRRVALASLILKKPDVLLLDEPTNHLDVYMVEFLEDILLKEKFTLLFISHDRFFIDSIATRVAEVENGKLVSYRGGYKDYLTQKEQRLKALEKAHENLLKLLKQEEEWLSKSVRAREKRNQGRKQRVFELREQAKKTPSVIRKLKIELEREKLSWRGEKGLNKRKLLFDIKNISYSIGDKLLIKDFSNRILQRDKIGVVGVNGAGKSTLLKLLLGELKPDSGEIKRGEFEIGYFDQQRSNLKDDETLIETFCPNGGDTVVVQGRNMHVYAYLKSFLFPEEFLTRKVGELSGGEKNRVALALLFTKKVNCLILDEPTNDLDIQTINILEEKLINFAGAVIFVSHDRYFVDKVASKLFIFKGDGVIEESYQSYSEYLEIEKELKELEKFEIKVEKEQDRPKRERQRSSKRKLSYKEKRELEELPAVIEELEKRLDELNSCLSDPDCYSKEGLSVLSKELSSVTALYEEKSERYLNLLELLEEIENLN
jgi:ATP-binding cassette subfamily F protein uup